MSRAIQCVARVVYPLKKARTDPTVIEARGLFLLDEFPRRYGSSATPPATAGNPAGTPAGDGTTPVPGASPAPSAG